jgi:UDP-MurNAc hydroxylase
VKLTIISQACLLIESGRDRLIIDPWILGSCYWRSWWLFPPPRGDLVHPETITAIYYTHEHPDHFHFPSLRRFPQSVRILVPRFPAPRMATQLRERGYLRVEEIPHGGSANIGALELFSYQSGADDSAVAVTDGTTTVLDMNDAKPGELALRQIRRRHPRVDFLLRSHAPAQSYPFCYTASDERALKLLPLSYYTDSFASLARLVRPRWAIPFASNVCHLHPESIDQNRYLISADAVVEACRDKVGAVEIVPMSPGDSWASGAGFALAPRPSREERERRLRALQEEKSETLARAAAEERATPALEFELFRDYFERFVAAVPWPLRRAFASRVAFVAPDGEYLVVDLGSRRVYRTTSLPADVHSVTRVDFHMLRDAISKSGVNLVGVSKRARIHIPGEGLTRDAAFWGLLTFYELGYFPLRNLWTARAIAAIARRWREIGGAVPILIGPRNALERVIELKQPRAAS